MKVEEFIEKISDESDKDYGICPPPISAQEGLNILINHFLGENWYTTLPLGQEQVNTEAIGAILEKYPRRFWW